MSYGFRAINDSGVISVDEDSYSYVYLGKYTLTQLANSGITCVGYPLIFFDVPYAYVNSGESDEPSYSNLRNRCGLSMVRLRPSPSAANTWIVTMAGTYTGPATLYARVFGKLHLNFPNGAGQSYGARAWNAQGELIFDTGCRQLRLAGNTYDLEMAVSPSMPGYNDRPSSTDSSITLPFNMAGKSIMANTRGTIRLPYQYGQYYDVGLGAEVYQYEVLVTDSVFWANGNKLYSKKSCSSTDYFDQPGPFSIVTSGNLLYTRVAVIDNNLFP